GGGRGADAPPADRQAAGRLGAGASPGGSRPADTPDPAEVRRPAVGDPRDADRGHRIVVGRLAAPPGTRSGHPRFGGRPRPADPLPWTPPAGRGAGSAVVARRRR